MTTVEVHSLEEGICLNCGRDDVECLEDCTVHACVDCGYTVTTTYLACHCIIKEHKVHGVHIDYRVLKEGGEL